VQLCGTIYARSDTRRAAVRITVVDVTDGVAKAQPVHSRLNQWQAKDSPIFAYTADLGRLPNTPITLSDWTSVAQIDLDWLIFPYKGERNLQFNILILSCESGEELARAKCVFCYENPAFGYVDLQENIRRAKTLAVALAFAVSAADNKLYDCEIELIKKWVRVNFGACQASNEARHKLEDALNKTVCFFRDGNQLDTYKVCKEIVEISPLAERCDVLELCLHVAQANGTAAVEEVALLKKLAGWLEVDRDRFRAMMGKILPVGMHEVEDAEVILGVTSDMGREETRRHLNKEYRKWNARVTSCDPEVQSQADRILKFIAEARTEYVV
jgi:tellurite resistance protein